MQFLKNEISEKQTFQNYELLNISREVEIYRILKPWYENSLITEWVWENKDNSQVLLYLKNLKLVGNPVIPNVWECTNSHNMEIFCRNSMLLGNSDHSQSALKTSPQSSKISYYGNTIGKTTLSQYYELWLKTYSQKLVAIDFLMYGNIFLSS